MDSAIETSAMRKVYLRILPLTMLLYVLCYIDRINVSFAALTMSKDIGLDAWTYGLSSTAFYLGYVVFEVPGNLIMDRVGARLWLARIMISWGIASALTAAVWGPSSFLIIRFLLGAGEAGLFPGTLLLFTYWFPDGHRARIIGAFTLALPISVALGAPISTAILGMDGVLGIKGWQWIYIVEALPTIIVGFFVLVTMTDRPAQASWLTEPERNWLAGTLETECRAVEAGDASRIGSEPLNLFWFAHHTVLMAALSRIPAIPCLTYGNAPDLAAAELDAARVGAQLAGQEIQERRLSRSIGAQHPQRLAGRHGERQAVDHPEGAVALRHCFDDEDRRHG